MLIGITGTIGAGKGAVVEYLVQQKKFTHISARSIWTLELEARKLPVNRDTMTVLANQLRAEHGADYFVRRALEEVSGSQDTVIESVRTVAELELLHTQGATILAVDAPEQLRYLRVHGRGSALDDITFEDFVRQEKTEMSNIDPAKQNLAKVMEMADYTVINQGTLEELGARVEEILKKI
jgi:dephospho-CoA kinase